MMTMYIIYTYKYIYIYICISYHLKPKYRSCETPSLPEPSVSKRSKASLISLSHWRRGTPVDLAQIVAKARLETRKTLFISVYGYV